MPRSPWQTKKARRSRISTSKNGDEARFDRYLKLSAKCALGRAQFESPRYAAIAVANQEGQKIPDIYKQDPYKVMDDIIDRWFAAAPAERDDGVDGELVATPPEDDGVDGELA